MRAAWTFSFEPAAWSLAHFLWQGAALAALAAAALRLLDKRRPEVRYGVAVSAMLLMMAAPAATVFFYTRGQQSLRQALVLAVRALDPGLTIAAPAASTSNPWAAWVVAVWLGGVAVGAVRLALGWRVTRGLLRSASDIIPQDLLAIFEDVREGIGSSRPIRLLLSAPLDSPAVIGWLRPAILLPVTAITGLDAIQRRAVLAHELAHIRRHDFAVNILQRCVEALLFYHPAVWWLSRRIRIEREHCCDDAAVRACGDPLVYARALIAIENARGTVPGFAMAAAEAPLRQRILRLLGRSPQRHDWFEAAAAMTLALALLIAAGWQTAAIQMQAARPPAPLAAVPAAAPIETSAPRALAAALAEIVPAPSLEPTPAQTAKGIVTGRILGVDGKPAEGIRIAATVVGLYAQSAETGFAVQTGIAFTNAEGRYRLDNLLPGRYMILAYVGPAATDYQGNANRRNARSESVATVAVAPGLTTAVPDFALPPPACTYGPSNLGSNASAGHQSLQQLVDSTQVIVEVYVQSAPPAVSYAQRPVAGPARGPNTAALLRVVKVLKGPEALLQLEVTQMLYSDMYQMETGQHFIAFLHQQEPSPAALPADPANVPSLRPAIWAGLFCVDGQKVRLPARSLLYGKYDGMNLEEFVLDAKAYAGTRRLVPGRVLMDGGVPLPVPGSMAFFDVPNHPQGAMRVLVTPVNTNSTLTGSGDTVAIDRAGGFTVDRGAGAYRIKVDGLPFGYTVKSISYGAVDLLRQPLRIDGPSASAIEVTLAALSRDSKAAGAAVRGRVTGAAANGSGPALVSMRGTDSTRDVQAGAARLQADGSFEFRNVPAGSYIVEASPTAPAGTFLGGRSTATVVVDQRDVAVELPLFPGSLIIGHVAWAPDLRVAFRRSAALDGTREALTAAAIFNPPSDGVFRIWLPPGQYLVSVEPPWRDRADRAPAGRFIKSIWFGTIDLVKGPLKVDGQTPLDEIIIEIE